MAIERNAGDIKQNVDKVAFFLAKNVSDGLCDLKGDVKEGLKETLIAAAKLDTDILKGFGETNLEMLKAHNILERQAADNSSTIRLEALKYKAELEHRMDTGFCAVQQKIDCKSAETNNLIRDLEACRIKESLAACNNENLFLKLKPAAVQYPVHHHPHLWTAGIGAGIGVGGATV